MGRSPEAMKRRSQRQVERKRRRRAEDAVFRKEDNAKKRIDPAALRWREKNRDLRLAYLRAWRKAHPDKRKRQPTLSSRLRGRLNKALRGEYKAGSAVLDLGCSIQELKRHLERQFAAGMSWDNYGEWHIDHIRPLA